MEVVGELVNSAELIDMLKREKTKGKVTKMCKAITELIEEGRQEETARANAAEARAEQERKRAEEAEKELNRLRELLQSV